MPLQNRVSPSGDIQAVDARGTMMGNRGIIHDYRTRELLSRRWQHQAWICCVLEFKDFQHPIMGKSRYTELFFLDEATALSAGHRPCAYCRRSDFNAFKRHWVTANRPGHTLNSVKAPDIDRQLHRERTTRNRLKVTFESKLAALPLGTVILNAGSQQLVHGQCVLEWNADGYRKAEPIAAEQLVTVLSPRSIVAAMSAGYRPAIHASAVACLVE
ncbi:MAG: hypothetical protein HOI95_24190 [Chromatiales bacterium]|jgi:hypothetical protein|nr:hypothetical protein [Chromatiales bacterium]